MIVKISVEQYKCTGRNVPFESLTDQLVQLLDVEVDDVSEETAELVDEDFSGLYNITVKLVYDSNSVEEPLNEIQRKLESCEKVKESVQVERID